MPEHTPPAPPRWAPLAAIAIVALAALLRFPFLDIFPSSTPDEGGWPLAVRSWVDDGDRTYDLHSAPGYHAFLGLAFAIGGSSFEVARVASVLAGLLALPLWYFGAARAVGHRAALIGALLLATSFDAVTNDRRALIEPYQMLVMAGLFWAWTTRTRHRTAWVAGLTAALLITKAIAIVFVVAVALSTWLETGRDAAVRRRDRVALAIGVGTAILAYVALYISDPPTFLRGWGDNVALGQYDATDAILRVGRFGIAPSTIADSLLALLRADPLVLPAAVAGIVLAIRQRTLLPLALGLPATLAFLLLQVWQAGNYFHPLTPMACVLAGWWLAARPAPWRHLIVASAVLLSSVRLVRGVMAADPTEHEAATAFGRALTPNDHVLSAAYLSMQLPGRVTSYPELARPYLPPLDTLRARGITWVLYDHREWRAAHALLAPDAATTWLQQCCELDSAYGRGVFLAYRVRDPLATR